MRFAETVENVADLAEAVRQYREKNPGQSVKAITQEMRDPPQEERALITYLDQLDDETVLKLYTMMYAGREKDPDISGMHTYLRASRDEAIGVMLSKVLWLGRYLRAGVGVARGARIELESPFAAHRQPHP